MSQDLTVPSSIVNAGLEGEESRILGKSKKDYSTEFTYDNQVPVKIHTSLDTSLEFSGDKGSFASVSASFLAHYGLLTPRSYLAGLELASPDEKGYAYTITERFTSKGISFYQTAPHGQDLKKESAGLYGSIMALTEWDNVGAYFDNGKGKGFYPALNPLLNTIGKELTVYTGVKDKIIYFPVRMEMQKSLKANNPVIAVGTFDGETQRAVLVFDIMNIKEVLHYCVIDPHTKVGNAGIGAPINYYSHHEMNIQYLVMAKNIDEALANG